MADITEEQIEGFALVAQTINNLLGALELRLPAETHIQHLRPNLKDVRDELRRLVVEVKGEDPWEGHPAWE